MNLRVPLNCDPSYTPSHVSTTAGRAPRRWQYVDVDLRELLSFSRSRPVRLDDCGFELLAIEHGIVGQVFLEEGRVGAKLRLA